LKMELIEGSETSANHNRTPGKYPKEYIQDFVPSLDYYFKKRTIWYHIKARNSTLSDLPYRSFTDFVLS